MERKKATKTTGYGQRLIDIAQSRGHTMDEILEYDVIPDNSLFQDDGLMLKANKSLLTAELEKSLSVDDYNFSLDKGREQYACMLIQ